MLTRKLLVTTAAAFASAALFSTGVNAATVSATANATVLTPMTVTENTQMNFGTVAGDSAAGGTTVTVTLGTNGALTAGTGAYALAGSGAAGAFTVTGNSGAAYTISLPANGAGLVLTGPGANMGIDFFTAASASTGAATGGTLTAGTDTFNVGAQLSIPPGETAGAYTGTYAVTVNYQ